jgi:hypothetical protein
MLLGVQICIFKAPFLGKTFTSNDSLGPHIGQFPSNPIGLKTVIDYCQWSLVQLIHREDFSVIVPRIPLTHVC